MNTALLPAEARRALRNRRTLIFAAVLPVVFFTTFSAGGSGTVGGLAVAPYVMVGMATYGAMNALFTDGGLIAAERAVGWNRQLRVAGLRGRDYLATKVSMAYVTAVPGLLLVFVAGALGKHVRLGAAQWVEAALSVLLGLVPVSALGVAVGYAARPQSLQPLLGIGSALLALLGGLWVPVETFPRAVRDVMTLMPTYWSADAGRAVLRGGWVGWHGVVVIAVWTVALGALAVRGYRRDALRPAAAGAT
ncbi:MAG TPA: ABC transporter permease [Frankiaceae bacterium]|nr:ABC transporter permease [Frankiaceae bacterium]